MTFAVEEVLLSTTDLAAVGVNARLLSRSPESLRAVTALCLLPNLVLYPRNDITAEQVLFSEVLNQRKPAAWLMVSACQKSAQQLVQLASDCTARGMVLTVTGSKQASFDLVLVPRQACSEDGVAFAVFATRVDGIRFISQTIAAKQVAVVLDLDSTLIEAEHIPLQPSDWRELPWKSIPLKQQPSGQAVVGRVCQLPDEPHHAESVHAASWMWKGAAHNYRLRQRLGWSHLRDVLIQECYPGGKLSAYVLSLGRPLYIQTAWQILDPAGRIIPLHEFPRKVNSARPDGVYIVPEKTPCIGVGLRTVFDQDYNMRLGPVWVADDLPEVFMEKYRDSVYQVPAYKPVAGQPNAYDADGSVLRNMADSIMQYWQHCYGADGSGGAVAQVSALASRTLQQLCTVPLVPGNPHAWSSDLFKDQEPISSSLSVHTFLLAQLPPTQQSPATSTTIDAAMPENDENVCQSKASAILQKTPVAAPLLEHRALRPSSRQDVALPEAHQPNGKLEGAAGSQMPYAAAAVHMPPSEQSAAAVEDAIPPVATISIVPAENSSGNSKLVLVLGNQPGRQAAAVVPAYAADVSEEAVDVNPRWAGNVAEDAVGVYPQWAGIVSEDAVDVYPRVQLPEAIQMHTTAEDVEIMVVAEESSDESSSLGRKRDFSEIAGRDTLMGPDAPSFVAAGI